MPDHHSGLHALADQLALRRDDIVASWRSCVEGDQTLTTGDALPRAQLVDHIPALLEGFEAQLRDPDADISHRGDAAAHGLHRWQQGFGLAEVSRELGHLNECVVREIDRCAGLKGAPGPEALSLARSVWASVFSVAVSASTAAYFKLQQMESTSYVGELEAAMGRLGALEQQRATLWQQAAHDLRGNLGVVANVAAGLGYPSLDDQGRENFLRLLGRNLQSLHNLLDDITCLARLQGGQEPRRLGMVDVAALLTDMGENLRLEAAARHLSLEWDGATEFLVQSDAVKLQRIVQNLVLNAIRYTETGGVQVSWERLGPRDPDRWALQVRDTGPGLAAASGPEVLNALEHATEHAREVAEGARAGQVIHARSDGTDAQPDAGQGHTGNGVPFHHGEGIGLAIVKRLCEVLDATILVKTGHAGTCFRILLPTHYATEGPVENAGATDRPHSA